MDVASIADALRFSPDRMQKVNLFETDRLFCDVYCFEPGQTQALHAHAENDKVYVVLAGRGRFSAGGETRELGPQEATIAPAGSEHGVVNDSTERLIVLAFMAPHPGRRGSHG